MIRVLYCGTGWLDVVPRIERALAARGIEVEIRVRDRTREVLDQLADVERLKGLFEAFGRQRDILHLLDQSMKAEGVQIFIGHESGYELLDSYSIVAAPYATEDDTMGVLGVIGPTRMAYERVIPIVDVTAKLLGRALKSNT